MRNQVDIGQAQAFQPTAVVRVDGLVGKFRMGIHPVGTVHRARTAAHHHAWEIAQQLLKTNLVQEPVLRGHVSSAKNHPVGLPDQFGGPVCIAAVQHRDGSGFDAGSVDAQPHSFFHGIGETPVVRRGAHQQHARRPASTRNLL